MFFRKKFEQLKTQVVDFAVMSPHLISANFTLELYSYFCEEESCLTEVLYDIVSVN